MSDIFISYSSKDRAQAEQLTELLASAGLSVWIDNQGIVGAEKWATEIVEGINSCSTFLLLISPHSVASENVLRELSLASEKRKRVLPVDLGVVQLPSSFEYPLAGLQRVAITDIDAIVHAHKHGVKTIIKKDERKSLMILPFEDLSPTGDNGWFADGIVSELISALSNVKSIRIADNQATKEFKKYSGQLSSYAREMDFRYFVQGDVRKYGGNIKITARLLDIGTGDYLWQDSLKGTMENIFDFQEEVALKVVEGLKVHLAFDEKKKLAERGTENAEAYELYLKACEYFERRTKDGFHLSIGLNSEAIRLDPEYANPYTSKASALAAIYRNYDRNPALLVEAELLCHEALRMKPDLLGAYGPLSTVYMLQGKFTEAEEIAKEFIRKAPEYYGSHFSLGFFYMNTDQYSKAIAPWEEAARLNPDHMVVLFNLAVSCHSAKETEKRIRWATIALPIEERHLKLHPDDEHSRLEYAVFLFFSGRREEALIEASFLKSARDGQTLYNTACLFVLVGEKHEALNTIGKATAAGYKNIAVLKAFLNDEDEGIASLTGTSEYEKVKRVVEKLEAEQTMGKTNG